MSNVTVSQYIIDEVIDKFTNNQLSYRKMIDDLGMVKNIVATSGNTSVLLNSYTYSKTRVTKEVLNANKMNITYQYDSLGNVTQQKETKGSTSVTKIYQYDAFNRLYIENGSYGYKKYNYDPNGNILSVANNLGSLVKTFNYDSTYKSLLTYVSDNIYGKTYSIVYPKDSSGKIISPNPIQMYVNGESTNFVYDNSSRIISFSKSNELLDLNVIYDSSGRRVVKEGPVFDNNGAYITRARHEFEYDGDLLIYEKIIPLMEYAPYIVETELFYKYDNNGILIGVEVEGEQYFYIRDILGNIKYIIDSSGTTMVEYTYDSWGKLLQKTINSNPLIGYLNSIIYKEYYYDVETGYFWLSSRYYSPELGRFIQPADVSSLNPHSINGLNLYAYANNNPISIAYSNSSIRISASGEMVSSFLLGGITNTSNIHFSNRISRIKSSYTSFYILNCIIYCYLKFNNFETMSKAYSFVAGFVNEFRSNKNLQKIEIFETIDDILSYGVILVDFLKSIHGNFSNPNLSFTEKIGYSQTDALYYFTKVTITYLSQVAAYKIPIPYAGVFVAPIFTEYFLALLDNRWESENCEEFYNDYHTQKTAFILYLLMKFRYII